MLDFAQLLDSIQPPIDLRNKEEVKVRFVPVLKDKTFQGMFLLILQENTLSKLLLNKAILQKSIISLKHWNSSMKTINTMTNNSKFCGVFTDQTWVKWMQ